MLPEQAITLKTTHWTGYKENKTDLLFGIKENQMAIITHMYTHV